MDDDARFFRLAQLMPYWRRSESALRRAIADGALRVLRHRRRLFVSIDEIRRCEVLTGGASPASAADVDAPLLGVGEASRRVGYKRSYLYELAARGDVPSVRLFGSLRFRERDLAHWLAPDGCAPVADALNENRTPARPPRRSERNGA